MTLQTPRFPGSNAERSRLWNRALVLRHVRTAGASGRAEIARASGLSTQAVSNIIADLTGEGLLAEIGRRQARRGLPVAQYAVAPSGGHALGVELRPDAARAVLSDLAGRALWSGRRALAHAGPDEVAGEINTLRDEALAGSGVCPDRLLGIGVVMPGPFGHTGLAAAATELPGWEQTDPAPFLESRLGCAVVIENDANAAAVAERLSGVAQGLEHYAFLYFGAGLGLGIVSDAGLLRGAFGNAGEIGHVRIDGRRLEEVASRVSLARRLSAAGHAAGTVEEIEAALDAPETGQWLDEAAAALGQAVVLLENLLDPQVVILGGALPDALIDGLISRIVLSPASLAARPDRTLPRLMRGAAGRMTATHGAAALVLDRLFTPRLDAA
ncbi:ROK family transcriptional regulator [Frigidibacter sp. ROC022]|uniref:ROK family transcriptional regulator n=1 Tax=Frigidibacter sp. ROC022 TaxID=2971796 RepID=UPI00215A71A2|nr:ROK family transcriptional regulator [Frigidibacter sp. ROC022]MCR8723298.1 ROK family transcriptional regulator [Frigidibacter sp. ROC022]